MLKGLAFLVLILLDITLMAQARFTALDELLRYADKNTVTARQTLLERSVAELDHSIARSGILPKLTVYGSGEYYPVLATQLIPESIFGGAPDKFRKVQFGLPIAVSTGAEITVPVINLEKWAQLEKSRLLQMQTNLVRGGPDGGPPYSTHGILFPGLVVKSPGSTQCRIDPDREAVDDSNG